MVSPMASLEIIAVPIFTGTPNQPKLTLTSTPALPQDEILSRIIFGVQNQARYDVPIRK